MNILVIEDEPKVAAFIKQGLEEQASFVTIASDGFMGQKLATENKYDAIVLDLMLPYINGIDLCKKLRTQGIRTPILMLTALNTTDNKVAGFDAGADDYLVKPFEFKELTARLKAITKRNNQSSLTSNILSIADLEMNIDEKVVKRSGRRIDLTAKEFGLLEFFLRNQNRVISRAEISEKVWDIHFDTGTNVIDVYVNFLRKKIDKDYDNKLLHTVIGMGYVLKFSN